MSQKTNKVSLFESFHGDNINIHCNLKNRTTHQNNSVGTRTSGRLLRL